jgi:hypothetical protein
MDSYVKWSTKKQIWYTNVITSKSILFKKKHAHGNDNSQQLRICELFNVQT